MNNTELIQKLESLPIEIKAKSLELIEELANRGIDARVISDFTAKELQDEIDRKDNEREIDIQARYDAEMAQEESDACTQAIAEDNARADQERADSERHAEAMQAEYEAESAQR